MEIQKGSPAHPFTRLGLPAEPIILAPLAGVSDAPFRRSCVLEGADLSYVEMISAAALVHDSKRTFDMLYRDPAEKVLGVQVTSRNPEEMGAAVAILDQHFDTIDINMGCPVRKVVASGCGSAILLDPERVYKTVEAARRMTTKPLSVKIRLGWDHQSMTYPEVSQAIESAGADWMTVHGRTRSNTYADPVNLEKIAEIKELVSIPVVGNGNIFSREDWLLMKKVCGLDGVMVSRGALGNPWLFAEIKGHSPMLHRDHWLATVLRHLDFQESLYGGVDRAGICMRKHMLWYLKGRPLGKKLRGSIADLTSIADFRQAISEFAAQLKENGVEYRNYTPEGTGGRFAWDPKYDMDRTFDAAAPLEPQAEA